MLQRCDVPGLSLLPEWLSAPEEAALIAALDAAPWQTELRRRVQHYGWRYDYAARRLHDAMRLGPLPGWAAALVARLDHEGLGAPDQVIVNEYLPGQGISRHIDHVAFFGPTVISLSLGAAVVMELTGPEARRASLLLPPRGLLILTGEARWRWAHAIPARASDRVQGARMPRGRRLSVTFRTVVRSSHEL